MCTLSPNVTCDPLFPFSCWALAGCSPPSGSCSDPTWRDTRQPHTRTVGSSTLLLLATCSGFHLCSRTGSFFLGCQSQLQLQHERAPSQVSLCPSCVRLWASMSVTVPSSTLLPGSFSASIFPRTPHPPHETPAPAVLALSLFRHDRVVRPHPCMAPRMCDAC